MAREAITRATQRSQRLADCHHIPAPTYQPGQTVWLSSHDLPLQVESCKLAPRFVGLFEVQRIINPSAVRLKLPASLPVHPTIHVSQIKPVSSSDLDLSAQLPATPRQRTATPMQHRTCSALLRATSLCASRQPGCGAPSPAACAPHCFPATSSSLLHLSAHRFQ